MPSSWPPSHAELDDWRQVGDPTADKIVEGYFEEEEAAREFLHFLTKSRQVSGAEFEPTVGDTQSIDDLLDEITASDVGGPRSDLDRQLGRSKDLFDLYGPEILIVLGCYSLPAAYSAANGAKVLAETDYLELEPSRRLAETAQMIVDVMEEGLAAGQPGYEAAVRTRLLHAAIRRLIRAEPDWDTKKLGVPINQEDMAATLMTFSFLVVDGLEKVNIKVSNRQKEAYLATWVEVGRLLGIDQRLLPGNFRQARQLTRRIRGRQIRASEEGRQLLAALVSSLEEKTIHGLPTGLMRLFLPRRVANDMYVHRHLYSDWILARVVRLYGLTDRWLWRWTGRRSLVLRNAALDIVDYIMEWQKSDKGAKERFEIPDTVDWWRNKDKEKSPKLSRVTLDATLNVGGVIRRATHPRKPPTGA